MEPPLGFGTDEADWSPAIGHRLSDVAALWLQHRLVRRLRTSGRRVSARRLAEFVGVDKDRAAQWLAGRRIMTLRDALASAQAYGVPLAEVVGDRQDLLPPSYDPWLGQAGADGWPVLRRPGRFDDLARGLSEAMALWEEEARAGREALLVPLVLLHRAVAASDGPTWPAATAVLQEAGPHGARARYAVGNDASLRMFLLPDLAVATPDAASEAVLRLLLAAAIPDGGGKDDAVLACLGPLAFAQLGRHGGSEPDRLFLRGHDLSQDGTVPDAAYGVEASYGSDGRHALLLLPL